MKDCRIMGLLAVFILGFFLLISGCITSTSTGTAPLATPTPHKVDTMTIVSVSTTPISTMRTRNYSNFNCVISGNGWQHYSEITITEAGIQTFEMKYLRDHTSYIGLYKSHIADDKNLIRWLSYKPVSEEYRSDCTSESGVGQYGYLKYGSYKNDFVLVNTSEFLEAGEYSISTEGCGPWSIKISHCFDKYDTIPTSYPGFRNYPVP